MEELIEIVSPILDKILRMELYVWEGDYGLKSIDSDCLYVIAYCLLTRAPVNINYGRSTMMHCKKYPLLVSGHLKLKTAQDIIAYLRLHGYTLDYNINLKDLNNLQAFANVLFQRFKDISYYLWWVDDVNYEELTYPWYFQAMPFPFNYLYPRYCRKMAKRVLDTTLPQNCTKTDYIYNLAAETFSVLSGRLGDYRFFYGHKLCSFDVLVYSYLAPLVYVPFPSDDLTKLLRKWPLLIEFVHRVHKIIFPNSYYSCKYVNNVQKVEDEASGGSMFVPFICACLFLMGAVYSKGLLNIANWKRN